MKDIEKIIIKYNNCIENFPEKIHLYQPKSIFNFLTHFEEINELEKIKVTILLNEYLDYILVNNIETKEECKEAFFKYIHPIGIIYKRDAKFILLFRYQSVLILLALVNLFLFFIYPNKIIITGINIIGVLITYYFFKMSKTTRVFGVNW